MPKLGCRNSGAGRNIGGLVKRELTTRVGVYRDVFEQSLLLDHDSRKPWNFLASLSAELVVISLVLLIPLLYRNHLPAVHWKDITVGPAPPPLERVVPRPAQSSGSRNITLAVAPHPFYLDPATSSHAPQPQSFDLTSDAPPTLGPGIGAVGSTSTLGTFTPYFVAGPPPPRPVSAVQQQPVAPLPVGGDVQMAKLVRKVLPEYPPIARAARISGVVRLIGTIGKDGTIRNLQLVSGHPMLARAALEAVQQWVYEPTLLNGKPVEVIAPIEVSFTISR
jgi:periplasmic protein TonB